MLYDAAHQVRDDRAVTGPGNRSASAILTPLTRPARPRRFAAGSPCISFHRFLSVARRFAALFGGPEQTETANFVFSFLATIRRK